MHQGSAPHLRHRAAMIFLVEIRGMAAAARPQASGKGVARLQAQALEDHRCGAEAGERGLQQVEADEGREQQPVGAVQLAEHQAQQDQ